MSACWGSGATGGLRGWLAADAGRRGLLKGKEQVGAWLCESKWGHGVSLAPEKVHDDTPAR